VRSIKGHCDGLFICGHENIGREEATLPSIQCWWESINSNRARDKDKERERESSEAFDVIIVAVLLQYGWGLIVTYMLTPIHFTDPSGTFYLLPCRIPYWQGFYLLSLSHSSFLITHSSPAAVFCRVPISVDNGSLNFPFFRPCISQHILLVRTKGTD